MYIDFCNKYGKNVCDFIVSHYRNDTIPFKYVVKRVFEEFNLKLDEVTTSKILDSFYESDLEWIDIQSHEKCVEVKSDSYISDKLPSNESEYNLDPNVCLCGKRDFKEIKSEKMLININFIQCSHCDKIMEMR